MQRRLVRAIPFAVSAVALMGGVLFAGSARSSAGTTERVSVSSGGAQGDEGSFDPAISADGRYVAFHSWSSNLVPRDNNGTLDVFVRDRLAGTTERVSVSSGGAEGDGRSSSPETSRDGRYVAFISEAGNLVEGDTNGVHDVFVHDRATGETTRVSVDSIGGEANGESLDTDISADGRYVVFDSRASNLVDNDLNPWSDVFVHDRVTGETTIVSVSSEGVPVGQLSGFGRISPDGRYVAFTSVVALNTFAAFVRDRATSETTRVSVSTGGAEAEQPSVSAAFAISAGGRYVGFWSSASNLVAGDTNDTSDVFVRDRLAGITSRVSVCTDGSEANGRSTGGKSMSGDGRYIAFVSDASNLVAGDANNHTDVFVHDRVERSTQRVSVDSSGREGNGRSHLAAVSADGRWVAFQSTASNLVSGDTNGVSDVFVHRVGAGEPCAAPPPPPLRYIAAGDSVAAGSDLGRGDCAHHPECLADSSRAYPARLTTLLGVPVVLTNIACNDETSSQFIQGEGGEPRCSASGSLTQLEYLDGQPEADLITVTIGANDVIDWIEDNWLTCVRDRLVFWSSACNDSYGGMKSRLTENLHQIYGRLSSHDAPVVVTGYYHIYCQKKTVASATANALIDDLNRLIRRTARDYGLQYVGLVDLFRGHEFAGAGRCSKGTWLTPRLDCEGVCFPAHPNATGHLEIARRILSRALR